jgi:hypothetical protein
MKIEDIDNMSNEEMKELLIKYINKENKIKEYRKKKNNEYYKRKTNKL